MDIMNLKPKYNIGQKLIYIKSNFYGQKYGQKYDSVFCYPITIQAITIYENCIKYIDNDFNEIDELELVPYDSTIIGEHIINEIERNIDK